MILKYIDNNAVYTSNVNGIVSAQLTAFEQVPSIFANSFLAAKAAVDERLKKIRSTQIEAAWGGRK